MARASTVPLRLYASTQSLSDTPILAAPAGGTRWGGVLCRHGGILRVNYTRR